MTEVLRPAEDVQATSASPCRCAQGRQRDQRGGLAPVPNDNECTQAGSRRAGSP